MKTLLAVLLTCALDIPAFAADDEKEADRVKESGSGLKEILNIPDDIPQDLLDKAECVVILPSVKKGAFGIGGSYGRGVMICRSGRTTPDAGEPRNVCPGRRQHRFPVGRPGHGFRAAGDESQGSQIPAEQQSEAGR